MFSERESLMNIHKSAEDYLEMILMLQEQKGYVRSIDIANALGVTKPSVSFAMKRLRENGYILMDEGNCITLTEKGMEIARRIYDRHKALTRFLIQIGVDEKNSPGGCLQDRARYFGYDFPRRTQPAAGGSGSLIGRLQSSAPFSRTGERGFFTYNKARRIVRPGRKNVPLCRQLFQHPLFDRIHHPFQMIVVAMRIALDHGKLAVPIAGRGILGGLDQLRSVQFALHDEDGTGITVNRFLNVNGLRHADIIISKLPIVPDGQFFREVIRVKIRAEQIAAPGQIRDHAGGRKGNDPLDPVMLQAARQDHGQPALRMPEQI